MNRRCIFTIVRGHNKHKCVRNTARSMSKAFSEVFLLGLLCTWAFKHFFAQLQTKWCVWCFNPPKKVRELPPFCVLAQTKHFLVTTGACPKPPVLRFSPPGGTSFGDVQKSCFCNLSITRATFRQEIGIWWENLWCTGLEGWVWWERGSRFAEWWPDKTIPHKN